MKKDIHLRTRVFREKHLEEVERLDLMPLRVKITSIVDTAIYKS
jgi:hypothetical protein